MTNDRLTGQATVESGFFGILRQLSSGEIGFKYMTNSSFQNNDPLRADLSLRFSGFAKFSPAIQEMLSAMHANQSSFRSLLPRARRLLPGKEFSKLVAALNTMAEGSSSATEFFGALASFKHDFDYHKQRKEVMSTLTSAQLATDDNWFQLFLAVCDASEYAARASTLLSKQIVALRLAIVEEAGETRAIEMAVTSIDLTADALFTLQKRIMALPTGI